MPNVQSSTPSPAEPLSLNGQPDHPPAASKVPYDPFDPQNLRVATTADIEVEKVLTAVPVRRPKRNEFIRVHPGPSYVLDTLVLEADNGMERECYLVTPEVQHLVLPELRRTRLFTAMTKRGMVFLWPVKLPLDGDNRGRVVAETALQGAEQAKLWVKLSWDRELGGYAMFRAKGDLGDPQWPDKSFHELIKIAFRHNLIDEAEHSVIRELAGELL